MKKHYMLLTGTILLAAVQTNAQTKIGAAGAPDGSAMLEVTSGTAGNKGLLLPRMTLTQRNAIAAPATGLMIYNTTADQVQVNTGTPAAPIWDIATAANSGWDLTGNSGTNPATNFIGTSDNQPLVVRTNNTEKLRVTSAGNVGIGNTAPIFSLDVAGGIRLQRDTLVASNGGASILWNSVNSGQGETELINYHGTGGGGFRFYNLAPGITPGSAVGELLRITGAGAVGIGTSAPAQTLHVAGTARIATAVGTPTTITGRNAAGDVGNVTLGTGLSLTAGTLSVTGGTNDWDLTGNAGTNPATNFIGTTDSQSLVIRTDNTEQVRVTAAGNVGINNSNPLSPLSFESTTGSKISFFSSGTTNHYGIGVSSNQLNYHVNPGASHTFFTGGRNGDGTELMRIQSNGDVGIGTSTPAQTLDVAGTARISTAVGTPTTITGRNATGDVGNVTLGSGLSLTGGVLNTTADNTDWNLTGNTGTNPATNFIGTGDAQPLVIRTSNTEQVRVTAAGDVGIGTTAPAQSLHVQGTARIATAVGTPTTITGRNAAGDVGNVALGTGLSLTAGTLSVTGGTNDWDLTGNAGTNPSTNFIGTSDAQPLVIRTSNTEKVRVTAAGNVGIGTASPAFTLDVSGGIKASSDVLTASNGGSAMVWNSVNSGVGETELINYKGTGGGGFRFLTAAPGVVPAAGVGELMRITGSGDVGIGTAAPAQTLHVAGTARISTATGTPTTITGRNAAGDVGNVTLGTGLSLTAGTLAVTGGTNDWDLTGNAGTNPATNFIGTSDNQPLVVRTNNTEKVRVTAAGNVGINNTNPLSPLSFASALGAKITLWNGGSTTNHFGIGVSNNQLNYHVTPGATHTFYTGGLNGDGTELMRIQSNGNVGIGTSTPSTKLNVNGGSLTVSTDATNPNISAPIIHVVNDGGGPNFNDDVDIFSYGASTTPEFGMWTARGTASSPQNAQANDYAGVLRFGTWVNGSKTELNRIQSVYTGNGITEQSRLTFHATSASSPLMSIESNGNVGIGTTAPTALLSVNGTANNLSGTWGIFSDARVKTVDGEYEDGLATVMKIHPVKFHYNANAPFKSKEQQIGIIAQEMEQIAPYMVSRIKSEGFDDLRQYNNQALPYMLVNAIQEQQAQIEVLKAKNEQLEAANKVTAQLMERVKQMEQMIGIKEIEGTSKVAGK